MPGLSVISCRRDPDSTLTTVWENVLWFVSFKSLPGKTDRRCLDWAPGLTAQIFFLDIAVNVS